MKQGTICCAPLARKKLSGLVTVEGHSQAESTLIATHDFFALTLEISLEQDLKTNAHYCDISGQACVALGNGHINIKSAVICIYVHLCVPIRTSQGGSNASFSNWFYYQIVINFHKYYIEDCNASKNQQLK